jgi:hypothetical protein
MGCRRADRASDLIRTFVGEVWNQRRLDLLDELVVEHYELRTLADCAPSFLVCGLWKRWSSGSGRTGRACRPL